ncbi:gamma-glutamylcyclotransferase family protein [Formosa sp. A9]|uniref:gamma-glutamylcyclotransferase family protein n=1 Tax=Formosa sp. A9 TaxID=3442641 RepID=UPI003EBEF07B
MKDNKQNTSKYLFVYGTLMQQSKHEMALFLNAHSKFIDHGYCHAKLFEVDGYPGAVLSANKKHRVYGQIYELDNTETVFKVLDIYEGINPLLPEPFLYKRELIPVFTSENTAVISWMYLYNLPTTNLQYIPSGKYRLP